MPIDDIKKIPDGLVQSLKENKPIIILMNPPYAKAAGGFGNVGGIDKVKNLGSNLINSEMLSRKLGKPSSQLYAQFLYKVKLIKQKYNLTNMNLCAYTPPLFLTGTAYKMFRRNFFEHFTFIDGMLFRAGHFADVSSEWGISFSIWKSQKQINNSIFLYKIKDVDEFGNIISLGEKEIYNVDLSIPSSIWVREEIRNLKTYDEPKLKSPLSVVENSQNSRKVDNGIGCMFNIANNVYYNTTACSIFSCSFSNSQNAFPISTDNFYKGISLFTARITILPTWVNQKDEYLAPNEQHPDYPQWNTDAIVYSLFNGSSNQSSLRQITYKEKLWDIKNEWFWMSNEQMIQLANENGFDELYHDAQGDHDRFVFNKIQESSFYRYIHIPPSLSQDAVDVYNKACELVVKTFPYRAQLHEEHPEWHLQTWDAGWYQIKLVLKKYFVDELKEFNKLYKKFEDRMRDGVYKFGFLK